MASSTSSGIAGRAAGGPANNEGPDAAPLPPRPLRGWQQALRDAIRDAAELCSLLELDAAQLGLSAAAARDFPLLVPRGYAARMRRGDPDDPLLRQVLPIRAECAVTPGFSADPVGDAAAQRAPGLLHKYAGRALLVTTGACAVHCRYCFRRHFAYDELPTAGVAWEPALAEISADRSLEEVIFSGGDPLTISDVRLSELAARLATIDHLRRLRIHTRLPIVLPERVDDALVAWLSGTRLTPIVVVHANHPAEIDADVAAALARLAAAGALLLNQAVLLAGVNDDVETLVELSRRLIEARVFPYYLHQLDRVAGAGHFEVAIERGRELVEQLRARLPGYLVPRYVQEFAGEPCKRPLS
ncbi:MAG: EF-P beta-lysylation protein EpmB [Pirellulales bacterium]|nr:EF-P beta-lysylation protein EpmB [Pirellulales bacterium]